MALTADIGAPAGTISPTATPASRTNVFAGVASIVDLFGDLKGEQARAEARAAAEADKEQQRIYQANQEARAQQSHNMSVFEFEQKQRDREARNEAAQVAFDYRAETVRNINAPDQTIYGPEQYTIFDSNPRVTLGAEGEAAVIKVEKIRKALVQGRVPQSVVDLRTRSVINEYMTNNPDKRAAFASALKDMGVDDPLIRQIDLEKEAQDFERSIQKKTTETYIQAATNVGLTVFKEDGSIDMGATMKVGETILREQDQFNRAQQQLNARLTASNITASETAAAKEEFGNVAMSAAYKIVDEATNTRMMSLSSLFRAASISSDPKQLEQLLTVSVPAARQNLQSIKSLIIQQLGDNVPPAVYKTVIDLVDQRIKEVDDLVSGESSVVKTRMAALQSFQSQLGLSNAQMFPVWNRMSQFFGQSTLIDMVSGGNVASLLPPDQLSALRQELATGLKNPASREAELTLSNLSLILGGSVKLQDLDPEKQRNALPGLIRNAASDARSIVLNGGGPPVWDRFVKSYANATNAVVASALPSTLTVNSFKNSASALVGGLGPGNRPLVAAAILELDKRPGYQDEARALANSSNIAGMQLLNGAPRLIEQVSQGGIYKVTYNPRISRYEVVTDQAKLQKLLKRNVVVYAGGTEPISSPAVAPSNRQAQELSDTLNGLLNNMASLRTLDPTFQGANVSFEEAKTFFATGKTPASVRVKEREQLSASQQFERAVVEFDKAVNESINLNLTQREEAVKARTPRGIRNNNPGNIEYGTFARRQGASGTDGRFAKFETPEEGIRAAENLVKSYGSRGLNTIEKIVNRWAPPNENNTQSYINQVVRRTGFTKDQVLDLNNPQVVRSIVNAKIWVENGQNPYEASN